MLCGRKLLIVDSCCSDVFCSDGDLPCHCKYVQLPDSRSVERNGVCQVAIPGVYRLPGEVSNARCHCSASSRITSILAGAGHIGVSNISELSLSWLWLFQFEINGKLFLASSNSLRLCVHEYTVSISISIYLFKKNKKYTTYMVALHIINYLGLCDVKCSAINCTLLTNSISITVNRLNHIKTEEKPL